ncbi:uncharacterized protein CELE_T25F10.1 [Caenorhabditis elegans]|uniref:Uncharacterized protein n=1 Tax=Caenorhabditis elegans TaxID=6239 RepID=Q23051_CAEEL|nr:Uncharacterized protein CELE_T25F10.1 [Caenorhabditis elegans]CCD74235.1 Uncharacterized protein CELE_T25F10.1 [Caenorhabditis elegans]|eukprot:NP_504713.1 Uncharacterized protein CELE_T25F10.1 [Caenorhabditis elegans]
MRANLGVPSTIAQSRWAESATSFPTATVAAAGGKDIEIERDVAHNQPGGIFPNVIFLESLDFSACFVDAHQVFVSDGSVMFRRWDRQKKTGRKK